MKEKIKKVDPAILPRGWQDLFDFVNKDRWSDPPGPRAHIFYRLRRLVDAIASGRERERIFFLYCQAVQPLEPWISSPQYVSPKSSTRHCMTADGVLFFRIRLSYLRRFVPIFSRRKRNGFGIDLPRFLENSGLQKKLSTISHWS